jgi:hypothetical protein
MSGGGGRRRKLAQGHRTSPVFVFSIMELDK